MESSNAPTHRSWLRKRNAPPSGSEELAPDAKVLKDVEEESNEKTPLISINDLPDELLGRVIRNLDPRDRVFSEQVCRQWSRVRWV